MAQTGASMDLENARLQLSLWLSERQKEEMLKYLINDFAKAFEPEQEQFESTSYFTSIEDATKMAIYDPDCRRLKK